MIQTSKVNTRKQILKYLSIFLFLIFIPVLLSTQVYAEDPIKDIGGGDGVTGGGEYFEGGYSYWNGGYRPYLNTLYILF